MTFKSKINLFGRNGERKYLNQQEREVFYDCASTLPLEKKLFCWLLYYTGARISEISNLTVIQIDFEERVVVIRTLKRRRKDIYRQIPLPDQILGELLSLIDHKKKFGRFSGNDEPLWSFTSRTASRFVKAVMDEAGLFGAKASALGLRHGFAVHGAALVPITKIQKWMGHGYLATTAIYLDVIGLEERQYAEIMWKRA